MEMLGIAGRVDINDVDQLDILFVSGVTLAPDLTYKNVAKAPEDCTIRPIVIGTGPCGMLTGLMLARMGFKDRKSVV